MAAYGHGGGAAAAVRRHVAHSARQGSRRAAQEAVPTESIPTEKGGDAAAPSQAQGSVWPRPQALGSRWPGQCKSSPRSPQRHFLLPSSCARRAAPENQCLLAAAGWAHSWLPPQNSRSIPVHGSKLPIDLPVEGRGRGGELGRVVGLGWVSQSSTTRDHRDPRTDGP